MMMVIPKRKSDVASTLAAQGPFAQLNELLKKWYYKPDLQAVRIVLGAARTHYLNLGDPVWLFLVAPPGSGKTTMNIMATSGLSPSVCFEKEGENLQLQMGGDTSDSGA